MTTPRLFVGGISQDTRERDLERFFKDFGHISEILIKNGFAFVEFEDKRDADDAIYELDGRKLLGRVVSVQRAREVDRIAARDRWNRNNRHGRGRPERTKYQVIVENLSSSVSWQSLKDFMRRAGEVTYGEAHRTRQNEGIIDFSSYSGMKRAIDRLDDTKLNGRRIKIREIKRRNRSRSSSRSRSPLRRPKSRSSSRSNNRSKSPSRSRSRSRSSISQSKSRSRSRSARKSKNRTIPRSVSRSKSRSRSSFGRRSKSRSMSRSASRSKSRDLSREKSKSRDNSREHMKSESKSRSPSN